MLSLSYCILLLAYLDVDNALPPWPAGLKAERLAQLPPGIEVVSLAGTSSHLVWLERRSDATLTALRVRGLRLAEAARIHQLTAADHSGQAVAIDAQQVWLVRGGELLRLPLPGQADAPTQAAVRLQDWSHALLLADGSSLLWFFTADGSLLTSVAGEAPKVHSTGYRQPLTQTWAGEHGLLVLDVGLDGGQARLLQPVPGGDFGNSPRRGASILDGDLELHRLASPARPALPPLLAFPADVRSIAWLPAGKWPEPWGGKLLVASDSSPTLRLQALPEAGSPPPSLAPFLTLAPDCRIAALSCTPGGDLFAAVASTKGTELFWVRPAAPFGADISPNADLKRLEELGSTATTWNQEERSFCLKLIRVGTRPQARLAAHRLGSFAKADDREVEAVLTQTAAAGEPRLRRAAALALGSRHFPSAADTLLNELRATKPTDAFLLEGWVRGLEQLGAGGVERLLDLANSGREADRERAVVACCWLRTEAAWSVLPRLMANVHLTEDQLTRLISCMPYLPGASQQAAERLRGWLEEHPDGPLTCRLAALNGLAKVNALKTAATQDLLRDWLRSEENADARAALLSAVELAEPPGIGPLLVEQLGRRGRSPIEQRRLLRTIARLKVKEALPSVQALVQAKDARLIHADCWETLAQLEPVATARQAAAAVASAEASLQPQLVALAANSADGAVTVGKLLEQRKLPPSLRDKVIAGLERHAKDSAEAAELAGRLAK